jgi:hypothetical protein
MEELIKQAFLHVDVIGPHVQAGHYDLIGPNGEIILPQVWDKVIEPDWAVTMQMWPMDRPGPAGHMGGRPGGMPVPGGIPGHGRMQGFPMGMMRPGMGGHRGQGPPPPPHLAPGMAHMAGRAQMGQGARGPIIVEGGKPPKKPSKGQKGVLSWMVGGKHAKPGKR